MRIPAKLHAHPGETPRTLVETPRNLFQIPRNLFQTPRNLFQTPRNLFQTPPTLFSNLLRRMWAAARKGGKSLRFFRQGMP